MAVARQGEPAASLMLLAWSGIDAFTCQRYFPTPLILPFASRRMSLTDQLLKPDETFANALAESKPWQPGLKPAGRLLTLLLLICLLPRAFMAWRADVMTEDGPVYIVAAMALERGDFDLALRQTNLGLNLFPVALVAMHKLGIEWELAGRLWSTVMAVLVVLPLFGLVRRQFNDRVATVACLLYASHACLIERSPEMLRCPTFWLLLVGTLYFLWRAVTEVRIGHFLAAGLLLTLGMYTRIETCLAVIPWLLWTGCRWPALQNGRARLLSGCVLGLLMFPALTVLVNVTWLRDHSRWETCVTQRLTVLDGLLEKVQSLSHATPAAVEQTVQPNRPAPEFGLLGEPARKPQTWARTLLTYVRKLVDAVDPIFGLLLLAGLVRWKATAWRKDQVAMLVFNLASLGLVLVFWLLTQEIQGRYFFPVVLVTLPYMAGGVLGLAELVMRVLNRMRPAEPATLEWVHLALLAIVGVAGAADALTNKFEDRRERRDLGQWVLQTLGPNQAIIGPEPGSMILAYYAHAQFVRLPVDSIATAHFQETLDSHSPVLVIIPTRRGSSGENPWRQHFLADARLRRQFHLVPPELLPASSRSIVFVRSPAWEQVAARVDQFD